MSWKQDAKRCPFCGEETQTVRDQESLMIHTVYCKGCKASVRFYMKELKDETVDDNEGRWMTKWNRRWKGK